MFGPGALTADWSAEMGMYMLGSAKRSTDLLLGCLTPEPLTNHKQPYGANPSDEPQAATHTSSQSRVPVLEIY